MTNPKILIDGDVIVYRCGFAAEKQYYDLVTTDVEEEETAIRFPLKKELDAYIKENPLKGNQTVVPFRAVEPLNFALANVKNQLTEIVSAVAEAWGEEPSSLRPIIFLSGEENFRNDVATLRPYKGGRDPDHKPVHREAIRDYLDAQWHTTWSVNEEADDMLGYVQMLNIASGVLSCIATIDKDLDMIPGFHYNFGRKEFYEVHWDEADRFFYTQLITGDATDNIEGIPGMGKVKAAPYAEKWEKEDASVFQMYAEVRALYVQHFGEKNADEVLLENARLLWIRRKFDEMWEPPTEEETQ